MVERQIWEEIFKGWHISNLEVREDKTLAVVYFRNKNTKDPSLQYKSLTEEDLKNLEMFIKNIGKWEAYKELRLELKNKSE